MPTSGTITYSERIKNLMVYGASALLLTASLLSPTSKHELREHQVIRAIENNDATGATAAIKAGAYVNATAYGAGRREVDWVKGNVN